MHGTTEGDVKTTRTEAQKCAQVADLIAEEFRNIPVKVAAHMFNAPEGTIKRVRAGKLSSIPILLRAVETFGLRVLSPLLGPTDLASLGRRYDAVFVEGGLAHDQSAAISPNARGLLDPGSGDGQGSPGAARSIDGQVLPGLALIETRRDFDGIPGASREALRRHLSLAGKVVSLDYARSLVKADRLGRTGLAYKHPGEDWKALVAPENRLWVQSPDPRPITEFAGSVTSLRNDLEQASRSTDPLFVTHAGALLRDGNLVPFHSAVVRIGGRAECGAAFCLTDFVRLAS
jgi:hypothetical protein